MNHEIMMILPYMTVFSHCVLFFLTHVKTDGRFLYIFVVVARPQYIYRKGAFFLLVCEEKKRMQCENGRVVFL